MDLSHFLTSSVNEMIVQFEFRFGSIGPCSKGSFLCSAALNWERKLTCYLFGIFGDRQHYVVVGGGF